MKKFLFALIFLSFWVASCEPINVPPTQYPQPVARIATETPAPFIIPLTDTPAPFIAPVVEPPPVVVAPLIAPSPIVSANKWWEVYFTDPLTINNPDNMAGSIEEKLIQFINGAQSSVHIASFEFNLPHVADALIAAKTRGVDVRWVTDDENGLKIDSQPGRGQFARLMANNIEVKDDAGRSALMHNKFWSFDKKITWTGSTNITVNGIYKQNNNVVVLRSPEVAYMFEREFEELWSGQFGPRAPSTLNNQWAILDGTSIQVLFSAEDHAVSNLIALVNDAKISVRFLAFSFTDYPLAKAMIDRAKAGVDVKGVFEAFGSNGTRSELKTFFCADVPARQDGNPSFLHDKIIIIDNSIVVTGSLNYSSSADDANEENVVIIDNAEIAALYLQEFEKLWTQAHDLKAGMFACQ